MRAFLEGKLDQHHAIYLNPQQRDFQAKSNLQSSMIWPSKCWHIPSSSQSPSLTNLRHPEAYLHMLLHNHLFCISHLHYISTIPWQKKTKCWHQKINKCPQLRENLAESLFSCIPSNSRAVSKEITVQVIMKKRIRMKQSQMISQPGERIKLKQKMVDLEVPMRILRAFM